MKTYVSRLGNSVSRQRDEQLRHPERSRARKAVHDAVITGRLPRPQDQCCADCGNRANEYDHHLGYADEHRLNVQPVCKSCHYKREQVRKTECRRGHPYDGMAFNTKGQRRCLRCESDAYERGRARTRRPHARKHRPTLEGSRRHTAMYLYEEHMATLDALVASGFAPTNSEAVRLLIEQAGKKLGSVAA